LDDDCVGPPDRLRLIILYLLYRDGLLAGDIKKLLAHAQLQPQDGEAIYNLDLFGARVQKPLKDAKPLPQPLFHRKPPPPTTDEETSLSRFEPNLKLMLEEQFRGTLDNSVFPSTRPHLDAEGMMGHDNVSQASLRSAKPTWARTRPSASEPRQRVLVFMAGGATFSEARTCYELSQSASKDIFLATSHMLTPGLFLRQLSDLSVDKRRLDIPAERPKPKAPAHLFEKEPDPPISRSQPPPTAGLAAMTISSKKDSHNQKAPNGSPSGPQPSQSPSGVNKPSKKDKDKKKRNFFKY
jgi:syntaxin-binding protein 1